MDAAPIGAGASSLQWPAWLGQWMQEHLPHLKGAHLSVLMALTLRRALSTREIAEQTGLSPRHVVRAVQFMMEQHVVVQLPHRKGQRGNLYGIAACAGEGDPAPEGTTTMSSSAAHGSQTMTPKSVSAAGPSGTVTPMSHVAQNPYGNRTSRSPIADDAFVIGTPMSSLAGHCPGTMTPTSVSAAGPSGTMTSMSSLEYDPPGNMTPVSRFAPVVVVSSNSTSKEEKLETTTTTSPPKEQKADTRKQADPAHVRGILLDVGIWGKGLQKLADTVTPERAERWARWIRWAQQQATDRYPSPAGLARFHLLRDPTSEPESICPIPPEFLIRSEGGREPEAPPGSDRPAAELLHPELPEGGGVYAARGDGGEPHAQEVWGAALQELRLAVPPEVFETGVRPTTALGWDQGVLVVRVPGAESKQWLGHRLRLAVQSSLIGIVGRRVEVRYETG